MARQASGAAESSSAATRVRGAVRASILGAALILGAPGVHAQTPPAAPQTSPPGLVGLVAAGDAAERAGESVMLTFANRPIVVLRAVVLGRRPAERAAIAGRVLDDLIAQGISGPVASQTFEGVVLINVGTRAVVGLTEPDIDELSGETLQGVAAQTITRLQQALDEAIEARELGDCDTERLARAVEAVAAGSLIGWAIHRKGRAEAWVRKDLETLLAPYRRGA